MSGRTGIGALMIILNTPYNYAQYSNMCLDAGADYFPGKSYDSDNIFTLDESFQVKTRNAKVNCKNIPLHTMVEGLI